MRTTLNIDDEKYKALKVKAAKEGTTVTKLLDELLNLDIDKQKLAMNPPIVLMPEETEISPVKIIKEKKKVKPGNSFTFCPKHGGYKLTCGCK